jgi:hypothetical protein
VAKARNIETLFCADLPDDLAARKMGEELAEMLAERSEPRPVKIIVTDEHENLIGEIAVPSKH